MSTFFRSYSTVDQLRSQISVIFTDAIMRIWPHSEFLSSNKNKNLSRVHLANNLFNKYVFLKNNFD